MVNNELLGFIKDIIGKFSKETTTFEGLQTHYNAYGNKDFEEVIDVLYKKGLLYADSK